MSDKNTSVTEFRGLTEPVTKLIETLSAGCGVLYEPTRIIRKAKADAEATVIAAEANAKAKDIAARADAEIEARAQKRVAAKESRRQKNIEAIAQNAAGELPDKVSDKPVDPDWMARFSEDCQDVSNEDMQTLWGRLLAGEVTRPGSFSLRTLALVRVLRKEDALLFTRLCTCCWEYQGRLLPVVFFVRFHQITAGLTFDDLTHLDSLGLIRFESLQTFAEDVRPETVTGGKASIRYHDKHFIIGEPTRREAQLVRHSPGFNVGNVLFTMVGQELAPLTNAPPDEQYCKQLLAFWPSEGVMLTETTQPPKADSINALSPP